jgi:hypothetical protein
MSELGPKPEVEAFPEHVRRSHQQRTLVEASGASDLPRSTDIKIDDAKGELGD